MNVYSSEYIKYYSNINGIYKVEKMVGVNELFIFFIFSVFVLLDITYIPIKALDQAIADE